VITPTPCWPTIPEQIKLADATPVFAHTHVEDGFSVHAQAILDKVTRGPAASSSTRRAIRPAR